MPAIVSSQRELPVRSAAGPSGESGGGASVPARQCASASEPPAARRPLAPHASPAAVETQYGVPSETPASPRAAAPSRPAPVDVSPCTTSPRHDGRVVDEARRTRQPRAAAARRSGARPPVTGCTSWPAPACRYDSPALTPDASPQRPPLRRAPPLSLSQSARSICRCFRLRRLSARCPTFAGRRRSAPPSLTPAHPGLDR